MIARARDGGIEKLSLLAAARSRLFDCGIQLAEQHEFILATIGIHPHEAKLATDATFRA
jgi:Tat protein secretion system quality control protein TatD with DNase activity